MNKIVTLLCVAGLLFLAISKSEGRRFRVRVRTGYSSGSSSDVDDLPLILGLSIGIPVGIVVLIVLCICCWACCAVCWESCCGEKNPDGESGEADQKADEGSSPGFMTAPSVGPGIHEPNVQLTGNGTAYYTHENPQQDSYPNKDQPPAYDNACYYPTNPECDSNAKSEPSAPEYMSHGTAPSYSSNGTSSGGGISYISGSSSGTDHCHSSSRGGDSGFSYSSPSSGGCSSSNDTGGGCSSSNDF